MWFAARVIAWLSAATMGLTNTMRCRSKWTIGRGGLTLNGSYTYSKAYDNDGSYQPDLRQG